MKTQGIPRHANGAAFGALVLALAFSGSPVQAQDEAVEHEYVGARKCKTCHEKEPIGNQYAVWLESPHAGAMKTLATDQAKEWAAEAGVSDPQTDGKCVKCHTTAYGVDEELLGIKYSRDEGVSCEACHGPGRDYRKKAVMTDSSLFAEKGLLPQSADTCLPCHDDESPAWDPARYTLADGTKTGFDYEQAVKLIAHPVPEDFDPLADGAAD